MAAPRGFGLLLFAVIVGCIVGSLLGDLLGELAGPGRLRNLLTHGTTFGLMPPTTLDLRLLSVTFGIVFKLNVIGALGILIALIAVRRF